MTVTLTVDVPAQVAEILQATALRHGRFGIVIARVDTAQSDEFIERDRNVTNFGLGFEFGQSVSAEILTDMIFFDKFYSPYKN